MGDRVKLAGWVLDDLVFHKKRDMVLKHFILPEMHFKACLFFPIMTPLTHPTTHPRDSWGVDTKRGKRGIIKVKKAFLDHVFFPLRVLVGWVQTLNGKFHYYHFFFLSPSLSLTLELKGIHVLILTVKIIFLKTQYFSP